MRNNFTIRIGFDRHGHLRELTTLMKHILKYSVAQFWGMLVMPNLSIAVTTWQQAEAYVEDIMMVLRKQSLGQFTIVMTAYLTDKTDPHNIREGFERGIWKCAKLYPPGGTTNSDKGVSDIKKIFPVLEMMQKIKMPLLVHPETDASRHEIDFFDRERVFTEESLVKIQRAFPELIISVEHITTIEAAQFVESCPDHVVGTVTPQHILYDHNALIHGGVPPYKPGFYAENLCMPILKYADDVKYIKYAIMHGVHRRKFGAGTDTAPHDEKAKHEPCSRCGVFNATHAVEFYAMAFDAENMFETDAGIKIFEQFISVNNLWIYGIDKTPNQFVELCREDQIVPLTVDGDIRPFKAGQTIPWTLKRIAV